MKKAKLKKLDRELSDYFDDKKASDIKEEAVVVAKKLIGEAEKKANSLLLKKIEDIQSILEMTIQQKSAVDSDAKKSIIVLQANHQEVLASLVRIEDEMKAVKEQALKTNGSVLTLKLWKSWVTGGLAMAGVTLVLVYFIFNTAVDNLKAQQDNTQTLLQKIITK